LHSAFIRDKSRRSTKRPEILLRRLNGADSPRCLISPRMSSAPVGRSWDEVNDRRPPQRLQRGKMALLPAAGNSFGFLDKLLKRAQEPFEKQ
jgi:hypothetical protein